MPKFTSKPQPFKPTKILRKLVGYPASTIKNWCYEKDKKVKIDPLKPTKKKTIKDKELDIPSLQKLLLLFVAKINELIETRSELEKKVHDMEQRYDVQINQLRHDLSQHQSKIRKGLYNINTPTHGDSPLGELEGPHGPHTAAPPIGGIPSFQSGGEISNSNDRQTLINKIKTKIKNLTKPVVSK
jgi:hypothetical protein